MNDKLAPKFILQVADVDIDKSGKFKYILINVKDTQTKAVKNIVRGYKDCSYHIDILSKVTPELEKLGLQAECSGGGRILHDPKTKTIMIYGYSQGFGRADHTIAHALCKKNFPDYVDISWSNEGY